MAEPERKLEKNAFRLSVISAGIVLVFSIFNGYRYPAIILRTALAFLFIYLLGKGLILLWNKVSPPVKEERPPSKIDIFLGDMESQDENAPNKTGQPAESLLSLKKRVPGQINNQIMDHLPDAAARAEIVRKMGWGDDQ
ncbi:MULTISPECIES: hypothetical protein [unclassified Dehalobacter]|uniref:hypothetical protein n=1 Tax=unclassified Dehalobacter TaxID=2635733 RepID=UPI00036BEF1D|nr:MULTISPECIES: hypothetical protein [unclassified Dehalobacter]RJE48747.1 hypothetical protein A7K50_08305 [Dehalobacter sp. MCB1]TCX51839.1 hypothetical protein C1I36_05825 [Dehalobacter sp. 14DCB1]TCX52899.1 hypothetical protein C1I38_07505 [Dehalobacter sp. 12DCB1]